MTSCDVIRGVAIATKRDDVGRQVSAAARRGFNVWWSNTKPSSSSRAGSTRVVPSSSDDTGPTTFRIGQAGTGTTAGRCSIRASSRANSALVVGCGAERLYAPRAVSSPARYVAARTQSDIEIVEKYWSPDPTGPPSPALNTSSRGLSAPPRRSRITDVRITTTRAPACAAGSAAACQSRVMRPMNVSASVADSSVSGTSPWSPYPATPFWARNAGFRSEAAIASASVRVVATLLSTNVRMYDSVHGQ